ncbi:hypothetical protein E0H89_00640 [Acinetobacter sp. ANC 3781]|uniref:hypothetical protein n=1 Tax=Acinetobacter sp. ANC 3781 TaxID=2529835 RepID=UPI001040328D|nr:hypothetical protein [Acinetobacter sp. ANC 3781]TCB80170.1 hypothetical protein E0H89_00640 [Acinetobacter sp. ANC 3781]
MTQTASHSQTPEFDTNKSQTTAILYQQPTEAEMRKPSLLLRLGDLMAAAVLIATISALTLMAVHGCSNDVDHQERMAVKHQLQFSANGGNR